MKPCHFLRIIKSVVRIAVVLFSISVHILGQAQARSFNSLEQYFEANDTSWEDSRLKLSALFQRDRERLGSSFESALWGFLAEDERKCYWIALFLDSKAYLHGKSPMPELALAVRIKGLDIGPVKLSGKTKELNPDKPDVRAIVRRLSALILSSISAEKLGKKDLSKTLKKKAEDILVENPDLVNFQPILSNFNQCIYRTIGTEPTKCSEENVEKSEGVVKDALINGKLVKAPKLELTGATPGNVIVEVIVDEEGRVKSATAVRGPQSLFRIAEKLAFEARFTPTIFFGRPWVVTSQITFHIRR